MNIFENSAATEALLPSILNLAVTLRDDVGKGVEDAIAAVLKVAGDDPAAALTVAAALISIDMPVDCWWRQPTLNHARTAYAARCNAPCGTHASFARHKRRNERIDAACLQGERVYQRDLKRAARARLEARRRKDAA